MLTCAGSVSGFILWRKRKPESVLGAHHQCLPVVAITIGLTIFLPLLAIRLIALLVIEFLVLRMSDAYQLTQLSQ